MHRQPFQRPPKWWGPSLSPPLVRLLRPLRRRKQKREERIAEVDLRGLENLEQPLASGAGVLVTPNHPGHGDMYGVLEAGDAVGTPFYFMTAWQLFHEHRRLARWVMQKHGCFSVDREGADKRAFREAVEILRNRPQPLVVFPEGEVYHLNDRVTPFREGAASMALAAARRGERPVVCVPCAIKFHFLEDPTPDLVAGMDRLEQALFWRPRPERPLADRIYRFGEAALALKEIEYLGTARAGRLPDRLGHLCDATLSRIEERYEIEPAAAAVPARVKEARREILRRLEETDEDASGRRGLEADLDDLFFVVQLFSYPGDYVAAHPSVERMAETLDKFEEDLLDRRKPPPRGRRRMTVTFGEPIRVDAAGRLRPRELTDQLERSVQCHLDAITHAATVNEPQ